MQLFAARFFVFLWISLFTFFFLLVHHPTEVTPGATCTRVIIVFDGAEITEQAHTYVVYAKENNGYDNNFLQTHIIKLPI